MPVHHLAQVVLDDPKLINDLARIAGLSDPVQRIEGYREFVRNRALIENYTDISVSWSASDVEIATCDVAWFMSIKRADAMLEGNTI